jgi:hypothetical protein
MAEEKQDNQKTIVAFVVGLLIGGLLVWAFSSPDDKSKTNTDEKQDTEESAAVINATEQDDESQVTTNESGDKGPATLPVGEGKVIIKDQPAGTIVDMESATYPVGEGWIGIRQYKDDKLGYILGVVRFSESQGLVPSEIILQAPTTAGNKYAVVIFTENGDFDFNLANDVQIDTIFTTFTAQ